MRIAPGQAHAFCWSKRTESEPRLLVSLDEKPGHWSSGTLLTGDGRRVLTIHSPSPSDDGSTHFFVDLESITSIHRLVSGSEWQIFTGFQRDEARKEHILLTYLLCLC